MKASEVKDILMEAMKKGRDFNIITNIAVGRGINGIDYRNFRSEAYEYDGFTYQLRILEMEEDYLLIERLCKKDIQHYSKKIYLDYNSIVSIETYIKWTYRI